MPVKDFDYNEDYRKDKEELGRQYQKFIEDIFRDKLNWTIRCHEAREEQYEIGENISGVEIKYDSKFRTRTPPALWIEYAEKAEPREGDYAPSGIMRDDNSWLYVIGDKETIFIFGKKVLRRLYNRNLIYKEWKWFDWQTSRCFLLDIPSAEKYAEKIINIG